MSYSIVSFEKGSHLLCVTDGNVSTVEEYLAWALEVISKVQKSGCKILLLDNRTFSLQLTAHDVVVFADELEKMGAAKLGLRIAVISNADNLDISRLVETSLVNRSATYKSFRSQADAMKWLNI